MDRWIHGWMDVWKDGRWKVNDGWMERWRENRWIDRRIKDEQLNGFANE